MNCDFNSLLEAAPYILLIYLFFKDKKIFSTPLEISELKQKILQEVSEKYLSLIVFREFEKSISGKFTNIEQRLDDNTRRFDRIDASLAHISDKLTEIHHE